MAQDLQFPTERPQLHLRYHFLRYCGTFRLLHICLPNDDCGISGQVCAPLHYHHDMSLDGLRFPQRPTHLCEESIREQEPIRVNRTPNLHRLSSLLLANLRELYILSSLLPG